MLFSDLEFDSLIAPLLTFEPSNREEAVALIAFSHLCEPSDVIPGMLAQHIGIDLVLLELINRASFQRMAAVIGPDGVEALEDALQTPFAEIWSNACERWLPRLSKSTVLDSLEWMNAGAGGIGGAPFLVLRGAEDYPPQLDDLRFHQPHVLWAAGNAELLLQEGSVAVVGTRQASRYGTDTTREIAAVAAINGIPTISGGAFGVDAVVHESAIALEAPTVAFMAGGLGHLYPKNNLGLLLDVAKTGLLVSESPPHVTPAKWRFLMRNRLIAAQAAATVVVEAGKTSGALNTAGSAVKLGRPVAIVPGQISSARSSGCHDFLNRHLGEVQILARPQDILGLVGRLQLDVSQMPGLGILEKRALDAFTAAPMETWEVQRLAGLTVRESQIALGSLEVSGLVERVGGRYLRVVS